MYFFVVRAPNQIDRLYRTAKPALTIGRGDRAELMLPNISVSREHVRITRGELVSLEPDNPVRVNGAATTRHLLAHGDTIQLGKYTLVYYRSEELTLLQSAAVEELPPHTAVLASNTAGETHAIPPDVHARMLRQEQLKDKATLVGADGKRWQIGAASTVGPGGDIPAAAALVRAPMAELAWQGAAHVLRRRGWLGKVSVNGSAVKQHTLRPGDRLQIGRDTFTYAL